MSVPKKNVPSLADRLKDNTDKENKEGSKFSEPNDSVLDHNRGFENKVVDGDSTRKDEDKVDTTFKVDNTKPHNKDNERPGNRVDNETPTFKDNKNQDHHLAGERPRSSGFDGSDSSEYVVTDSGTLVNVTNYDNRGNGVTDNYPIGYLEEKVNRDAVTVPSENAVVRNNVATSVYAIPAEIDDKGMASNVPGVMSIDPKTGEVLVNADDAPVDDDDDDVPPNAGSSN
jgi:hypothetical protein